MKAAGKKQKGSRAESEFARMLVDSGLDKYARRMVLSGAVKGFDSDIKTKLPFMFEVKNQETWKPLEYYRQANLANPNKGRYRTVVVMTKNREGYYILLSAEDFLELVYYALEGGLERGG